MKNGSLINRTNDDSRHVKKQALTLLQGPAGWRDLLMESAENRRRRAELQEELIERGVEVHREQAEQEAMTCKLQTQFEFQQMRSRELIDHRNAVTNMQIDAQDAAVHQITDMMEQKMVDVAKIDSLEIPDDLRELAKHTIAETYMQAAQDLIDRHDE